jgi:hypothetical protein
MTEESIWHRRHRIDKARRDKNKELMEEYDRTVYYPAKLALKEECANSAEGHTQGTYHDNGLGWHWWYCGRCGAMHGSEQHTVYGKDEDDEQTI